MKNFTEITRKMRVIKRHLPTEQKKNKASFAKMMDAVGTQDFYRLMPAPVLTFGKKAQ